MHVVHVLLNMCSVCYPSLLYTACEGCALRDKGRASQIELRSADRFPRVDTKSDRCCGTERVWLARLSHQVALSVTGRNLASCRSEISSRH